MSVPTKIFEFEQYNVTISKLFKLILKLNEAHQEALLKKGEELLLREKRAPRKSCRIPVRYTTFDRVYSDRIMNLSRNGVFIQTQRPIFVGEEIIIDFKIEGFTKPLKIKGKVVRASRSGVGIEFKNVSLSLSKIMAAIFDQMKG